MAKGNRGYRKALSVVLPAGALGASLLLSFVSSEALGATNKNPDSEAPTGESVSTRLQAIRSGVSDMTGSADASPNDASATPTWWGNGGWGRWRFGWRNGGWGNGGWHNWHNWGNGGWPNGWHNFWHNW